MSWAVIAMILASFLGSLGQMAFKWAAGKFYLSMDGIIGNTWLLVGAALYGIAVIINIMAYKTGEVSRLYPLIACSYIFSVVLAALLLKESLTWGKVVGSVMIIGAVYLISRY